MHSACDLNFIVKGEGLLNVKGMYAGKVEIFWKRC